MAQQRHVREGMCAEEVQDICSHGSVCHRPCMRRSSVISQILSLYELRHRGIRVYEGLTSAYIGVSKSRRNAFESDSQFLFIPLVSVSDASIQQEVKHTISHVR